MYDFASRADGVSRWTSLGVTLPEELSDAIEVFEAIRYTEVGYQPVFDLDGVTAVNAEDRIRKYADELAIAAIPVDGLSVLEKAKQAAADAAARNVVVHGRTAIPDVIEQLTPEFDQHARAYVDAVKSLPVGFITNPTTLSERLVAAGTEAVAAYGRAQQEAQYLNNISSWVASTEQLVGQVGDVVLRILSPSTSFELARLDEAEQGTSSDPAMLALNPVLCAAVAWNIEFGINTPAECTEIRQALEASVRELNASAFH